VLAILVVNEREVQNRIIHSRRDYSAVELQQASNYLNAQFAGKDIQQVRSNLLQELRHARETMDRMMQAAIEMADQAFRTGTGEEDYVLAGQDQSDGLR